MAASENDAPKVAELLRAGAKIEAKVKLRLRFCFSTSPVVSSSSLLVCGEEIVLSSYSFTTGQNQFSQHAALR